MDNSADNLKSFWKKNWFGLITLGLSIAALTFALLNSGNLNDYVDLLESSDKPWFWAAFGCVLAYWLIDSLVLHMLTITGYKERKFMESFKTSMLGLLYNALTPFSVGGQPMQIYEMAKTGIKGGDACSFITVKSLIHQVVLTVYGAVAVIFTYDFFSGKIMGFGFFVVIGLASNLFFIVIVAVMCVKPALTKRMAAATIKLAHKVRLVKNWEKTFSQASGQIDIFHSSTMLLKKEKLVILPACFLTLFQIAVQYLISYFVCRAFYIDTQSVYFVVGVAAIIAMVTAFMPLPGASGAAEGSFYIMFELFIPKALAVPALIAWRFLTYFCNIIIGCVASLLLIFDKRNEQKSPAIAEKDMKIHGEAHD